MYYLGRFHVDSRPDVDLFSVDFHLGLVYDYYLSLYLSRFEKLRESMIQDIVLQPRTILYETLYLPVRQSRLVQECSKHFLLRRCPLTTKYFSIAYSLYHVAEYS